MIIKFKQDYTGRETAMKEYKAGEQADLPTAQALELVRLGVAKEPWAEIGKLYDPKPLVPEAPQATVPQVGAPYLQGTESPQIMEEKIKPAPAKTPRKGKVKRDKNAS